MDLLHSIKYMQAFGFTLDEIRAFLTDETSELVEQRIVRNIDSVREEIARAESRIHSLEFLLDRMRQNKHLQIREAKASATVSVEITTLDEVWVLSTRKKCHLDADRLFSDRCLELLDILSSEHLFPAGPYIGIFHGGYEKQFTKEEADLELCIPILEPEGKKSRHIRRFGGDMVVGVMHQGHYRDMADTYEFLTSWIRSHGYEITGPAYEYYYCDLATTFDENKFLTKIYFPVREG